MARTVKCGSIQATNAAPTDLPIQEIKRLNIEKHLGMIQQAGEQGVQILCMQEVFTTRTSAPSSKHVGTKRSKRFPTARPPDSCRKSPRNTAW